MAILDFLLGMAIVAKRSLLIASRLAFTMMAIPLPKTEYGHQVVQHPFPLISFFNNFALTAR